MNTALATTTQPEDQEDALKLIGQPSPEALQVALAQGDLGKLSTPQRLQFLAKVCESIGVNPMTQPFEFIAFQGKMRLYVKRDATDQLRRIHDVSIAITKRETMGDLLCVTAQAKMANGRCDEAIGVVSTKGVTGDALAILMMKAETKAKRRVTLSICGLGFMDESEVEDALKAEEQQERQQIYGGKDTPPKPKAEGMMETHEVESTVVTGNAPPRHWSDLMIESAYRLIPISEGAFAGKQIWEVIKSPGDFQKAFKECPRTDTPERHALDCAYFCRLTKNINKLGYSLDEARDILRKDEFLAEDEELEKLPGERLLELGNVLAEWKPKEAGK
jgi:hypothetical protein